METKKATVTRILHNTGSYQGKYGTMYKHVIEFSNGDKGEYQSKSDTCTKFTQGEEANYTIEVRQNGQYINTMIKPVIEMVNGFVKKAGSGSDESFALSYSKDVACALVEGGKCEGANTKEIIARAEEFYLWLKSKKQ